MAATAVRTRSLAAYKGLIRLASVVPVDGAEETENMMMVVRQHFRRAARVHAGSIGPGEGFEAAVRQAEGATDTASAVHDILLGALQRKGGRQNRVNEEAEVRAPPASTHACQFAPLRESCAGATLSSRLSRTALAGDHGDGARVEHGRRERRVSGGSGGCTLQTCTQPTTLNLQPQGLSP